MQIIWILLEYLNSYNYVYDYKQIKKNVHLNNIYNQLILTFSSLCFLISLFLSNFSFSLSLSLSLSWLEL